MKCHLNHCAKIEFITNFISTMASIDSPEEIKKFFDHLMACYDDFMGVSDELISIVKKTLVAWIDKNNILYDSETTPSLEKPLRKSGYRGERFSFIIRFRIHGYYYALVSPDNVEVSLPTADLESLYYHSLIYDAMIESVNKQRECVKIPIREEPNFDVEPPEDFNPLS